MADDDGLGLSIPITAVLDGFNNAMKGVQDSVSGAMGGIKSKLGEVQEAFGAVGLLAGNYLKGAVDSAAKAQQSTVQLQGLLKNQGIAFQDTAKDITAFTGGITKMSTYSAGEAKNALINLTEKGMKYSDSLKSQNALANLAAGNNMDLTSASNLLAQAYNGRYMQLERLGIVTKEQVKNGMTYQQVLDAINKRFNGAAAAQVNTYAGQMKILSNNMAAMKTAIGTALLPVLTQLMEQINKILSPMIDFVKAHAQLAAAILATTAAIGTLVGGFAIFQKVSTILGPAVSGIVELIGGLSLPIAGVIAAIGALVYAYTQNFGGLKTFINGFISNIISLFHTFSDDIKSGLSIVASIQDVFTKAFGPEVGDQVGNTLGMIIDIFNELKSDALNIFQGIQQAFSSFVDFIKTNVPNIKSVISTTIDNIASVIQNIAIPLFKFIITVVSTVINFVKDNWGTISKVITDVFTIVSFAYKNILSPVFNGILKLMGDIINFVSSHQAIINAALTIFTGLVVALGVKSAITSAIMTAQFIKAMIQSGVESITTAGRLTIYIAQVIATGAKAVISGAQVKVSFIANIIKSGAESVIAGAKIVGSFIANVIKAGAEAVIAGGKIVANFIASIITSGAESAISGAKILLSFVANMIIAGTQSVIAAARIGAVTAAQWLLNAAMDANPIGLVILAIAGLIAAGVALYENWNTVKSAAGTLWNDIKSAFGHIADLGKEAFNWGKDLIGNLIQGIENSVPGLSTAVSGIASVISSMLHHSVPDEGPLAHDDEWMGDMMDNFTKGITSNKYKITNAIKGLATDMNVGIKYNTMPAINNTLQNTTKAPMQQSTSNPNINLSMNVDGKTWAQASLKYTELTQGRNNKFTARRLGVING